MDVFAAVIREKVYEYKDPSVRRILHSGVFQIRVEQTETPTGLAVVAHVLCFDDWLPLQPQDVEPQERPVKNIARHCADMCRLYDYLNPGTDDSADLVQLWHGFCKYLQDFAAAVLAKQRANTRDWPNGFPVASVKVVLGTLDADLLRRTDEMDLAHISDRD